MFGVDYDSADLVRDTGWYCRIFEGLRGSSLGGKGYRLVWKLLLLSKQHFLCFFYIIYLLLFYLHWCWPACVSV